MFSMLIMELSSVVSLLFRIFHSCFALVKISETLTHMGNTFHIQRQTNEYPESLPIWSTKWMEIGGSY